MIRPIRRRPLRRAIVTGAVGAAAYQGGKRKGQEQQAQATSPAPQAAPAPQAPAPQAAPAPPGSGGSTEDRLEQLKKLGELRDAGVLSDDEFQAEKSKILGT